MDDAVVKNLERGRDRIAKGWCVRYTSQKGPHGREYCALGSLMEDGTWSGANKLFRKSYPYVGDALGFERDGETYPIAMWNNTKAKDACEVVAVFDKAIELAKKERV